VLLAQYAITNNILPSIEKAMYIKDRANISILKIIEEN
jgi:hypothetical protein